MHLGNLSKDLARNANDAVRLKPLTYDLTRLLRTNLDPPDWHTGWYGPPALLHSIGITTMTPKQLRSIQFTVTQAFLAKMGINRNFPRAVTYGPTEYGGLAFPDLSIEQGIGQIRACMVHIYHATETGRLMKIAIHTIQVEAGTRVCLFSDPTVRFDYLTPCWLTSFRTFMGKYQLSLQMNDHWISSCHEKDAYLLDIFRQSGLFTTQDLKNLNAVWVFLQVATITDIATVDGVFIHSDFYQASRCQKRVSKWSWPRQPTIATSQQGLQRKALRDTILMDQLELHGSGAKLQQLKTPLGAWIAETNQHWMVPRGVIVISWISKS